VEELGKSVLFRLAWEAIQHQTTLFVLRDGRTFPFDMDHTYKEWRFTPWAIERLEIGFDVATRFDRVAMESGNLHVVLYVEGEE